MTYYYDQIISIDHRPTKSYIDTQAGKLKQVDARQREAEQTDTSKVSAKDLLEGLSQSVVIIRVFRDNKPFLLGTGFIIRDNGLIATNFHLIFEARSIEIETIEGKIFPVEFIANYNHFLDASILKAPQTGLPALRLADSNNLTKGQTAFSIGHPDAQEYQVHYGEYIGQKEMDNQNFLYFKIQSKQGSSGGPIFDKNGDVIAVSTLGRSDVEGFSYGIPINAVKPLINHNKIIAVNELANNLGQSFRLTYYGRGSFLEGKHEEAASYFQTALDLDPDHLPATIGLARTYASLNRFQSATQAWQQVSIRDPKNVEAHLFLGKTFLSREMLSKAIVHLEIAAALAPQSIHTYNDLGVAYGKTNNHAKAIELYQKTIDINPLYATGYFNLSIVYYNKHDILQAKEYCAQALKLGYEVPQTYLMELGL